MGDAVPDAVVLDLYAGAGALGIEALSRGARSATFVERDPRAAQVVERNLARCGFGGAGSGRAQVIVGDVRAVCQRLLRAGRGEMPAAAALGLAAAAPATALPTASRDTRVAPPPAAAAAGAGTSPEVEPARSRTPAVAPPPHAGAASAREPAATVVGARPAFTLVLADPPYATGEAARTLAMLADDLAALLHPAAAIVAIEHADGEEMPELAGNLRLMRRRVQGRGCVSVYGSAAPGGAMPDEVTR